ncbi:MAG: hypothetical protein A3K19_31245 [Lentisphaerae bacterium RIFOXYB12_FULL_65_16]|nr:MAG: hypothetical protein A3K18_22605 [Lentisphaerae bacterium RIFOXYA12_64_32]OGV87161.1 MAG: hypothetical protein A3K19_31245 [Lentisphaerae bacterium RIFOXYB12_FULL_65_16]
MRRGLDKPNAKKSPRPAVPAAGAPDAVSRPGQARRRRPRPAARSQAADGLPAAASSAVAGCAKNHSGADPAGLDVGSEFCALFETANDAILILDGLTIVDGNRRASELFGVPIAEIRGRTPIEFSPPLQPDGFPSAEKGAALIASVPSGGIPVFAWRHRRLDGAEFDVDVSLSHFTSAERHLFLAIVRDVSERKSMEAALRESIDQFQLIYENSTDAILWADAETGRIVKANRAAERLWERPREQLVGMHQFELHPPETRDDTRRAFKACLSAPISVDALIWTARGSRVPVEIITSLADIDGRRLVQGQFRDLTERRKAEEALSHREMLYQTLVETTRTGYVVLDEVGRVLDANPEYVRLTGHKDLSEIRGRSVIDWTADYEKEKNARAVEKCARDGQVRDLEIDYVDSRGQVTPIEINATVVETDGARRILTLCRDITERRRAEAALKRERDRAQQYLDTVEAIVVALDTKGHIQLVNRRGCELLGYAEAELIGRDWFATCLPQPEGMAVVFPVFERIMSGNLEAVAYLENSILTRTGETRVIEWHNAYQRDDRGNICGALAAGLDITQRKRAEEEARSRCEELLHREQLATLGTLVAGVAHEINNPANVITMNGPTLEKLLDGLIPILDEVARARADLRVGDAAYSRVRPHLAKLARGVTDAGHRIASIVAALKEFASPEDTTRPPEPVDVNEVVRKALALVAPAIRKSTSQFSVTYGADLPKLSTGRPQQIEQVVINLILNSCQALPGRDKAVRVTTSRTVHSEALVIAVEDEGTGIPAAILHRIKDPFFTTKRGKGGTGLGLSISDSIVTKHGGSLEFTSREGVGTTARIVLPLVGASGATGDRQ